MGAIEWQARPVALVTGGASGIGAASARALAARGARVAVLDVDEARGAEVAKETGGWFVLADVGSSHDWSRAVATVEATVGPIQIAHLNAGVMTLPPSADLGAGGELTAISDAAYRKVVGVNVDGVFFGLRALIPGMAKRARGRIVVTASLGGLVAVPFDPLYAMTKHALVGLVRSAAPALAARGISIAAVCPGGVDTPLVPDSVRALAPPLLAAADVGRAVVEIAEAARDGGIFVVRPGRPRPEPYPEPALGLA
jgi:NAD(P)-dependent dehydrogenase (short-subunit alcohol dehydrogenase family)